MTLAEGKVVSLTQATRMIYHVQSPSQGQIHKVYQQMKAGLLAPHCATGPPLGWTTTEGAIADFMALQRVQQARQSPAATAKRGVRLSELYHGIWRDYFLALMWRDRARHRSRWFRRAVLAGQATGLMLLVAVCVFMVRRSHVPEIAEHAAILRWIDERTEMHRIVKWHPPLPAPKGEGVHIEVDYSYSSDSPRQVLTRRTFHVWNDEVREVHFE